MIDSRLAELLACPACESRPPVELQEDGTRLVCTECHRRYPVREGIPVMLTEEASPPDTGAHEDAAATSPSSSEEPRG